MPSPLPERIWLQTTESQEFEWTWEAERIFEGDTEYVRADLVPSNAVLAVCEVMLTLYGPSGDWVGDAVDPPPFPRLWRMLQAVTDAPRVQGERWAPYEALIRELAARITGRTIDEVTDPLSHLLLSLKHHIHEDVEGMVVTELGGWEGEDGG